MWLYLIINVFTLNNIHSLVMALYMLKLLALMVKGMHKPLFICFASVIHCSQLQSLDILAFMLYSASQGLVMVQDASKCIAET
jgi:hypothetical protein